jgi:hypothetical protein
VRRGDAAGAELSANAAPPSDEDQKRLSGFRDDDLKKQ